MKKLFSLLLALVASVGWAADLAPRSDPAPLVVTGKVLEIQNVESYTYLRLKTAKEEKWVAITRAPVKQGDTVTIENAMVMDNFESRALKKTFKSIVFGTLAGSPAASGQTAMGAPHGAGGKGLEPAGSDVKVDKASGPNARTVAEINSQAAGLKDAPVRVRGKVVKFNGGIMGKNWIHLRDGSGAAADGSNDLLLTSLETVKLGAIVTAKGVVRTGKDFGSGYKYAVIVEDAGFESN